MASWSRDPVTGKPNFVHPSKADDVSLVTVDESKSTEFRNRGITTPGWVYYDEHVRANGHTRRKIETLVSFKRLSNSTAIPNPGAFVRTASTASDHHVHSGHSLTDSYTNGGIEGFPGDLNNMFIGQFGNEPIWEYNLSHLKDTIPGSPLRIRWDESPGSASRFGINEFDVLMITEGGPPSRPTPSAPTEANESLDYLVRFVDNAYLNGRNGGAETIVWSIWPNVDGWIGFGGPQEAVWGQFGGFRGCLDEYGRVFRFFAEYATWKMRRMHPDLPAGWRVWTFPGHQWMARVYDDIQAGLVPGITDHRQLFRDDIHPNTICEYALAVFVHTMLYQVDTRITNSYIPSPEVLAPALDTYFKRVAWEIAISEESVGMGGTAHATPSFDPAVYGDPLDPTYDNGDGDGEVVTPPVTGATPPTDSIIRWNAAGYNGPALTGTQPTVVGNVVRFVNGATFAESAPMTGFYACVRGTPTGNPEFMRQMVGLTNFTSTYDETAKLDQNGTQDQYFATHKPTGDWMIWVDSSSGVIDMTSTLTVEAWVLDGFVTIAVDGVEVQTKPVSQPIVASNMICLMASDNTDAAYDMNGLVVMNRAPTTEERTAIRSWVAS